LPGKQFHGQTKASPTDLAVERDAAQTLSTRREPWRRGRDALRLAAHDHRPLEQIGVLAVDYRAKRSADTSCLHPAHCKMVNEVAGGPGIVCFAASESALCTPPVEKQPTGP